MQIIKRSGKKVDYDGSKVMNVVFRVMQELRRDEDIDYSVMSTIEQTVHNIIKEKNVMTVEEVQDVVQKELFRLGYVEEGIAYVQYRSKKAVSREKYKTDYKLLSKEFLSKYKHAKPPMTELGAFVYYRTYSRWISELGRREYWWETVARAVDYNCSLVPTTTREEAEKLYDNIFNLRQFLSGRTFWVGGTNVASEYPMANYNCAFLVIDNFMAFKDLFYLLMIGSGVGIRILKDDVKKLPKIRTEIEVINKEYIPLPKSKRREATSLEFGHNKVAKLIVGDSKEGWTQALDFFLKLLYSSEYRFIETIIIDYDSIRPKGEVLKKFGGTASGHGSLKGMFDKITKVIKNRGLVENRDAARLKPIDCLDITNIIGENVVVGGVRRTAQIILCDDDDKEVIEAKSALYKQVEGQWIVDQDIIHRQMSNNSIYYREKPSGEQLHWQIQQMRYSGEPGWVNEIAGSKRRDNMNGVNPCGEILLDSKGLCNLTTINASAFVNDEGEIDMEGLLEAQRLSVRAGYRMTTVELEIPEWNAIQQRDRLLGCSLTGWQDMVNASNISRDVQARILRKLRQLARETANAYALQLRDTKPLLITTVKPEGTLSQLPTVSSGVHYSHSPYYVRRVRINASDPLVKVCEELGYPIHPEVGQKMENCTTKVIEFPVKAPSGLTKYDVTALEQLENYKLFMENYVDHNCSITVHVRDDEWEVVEEWVYDNWDIAVALSFLSLDDNFYKLLPYEAIEKQEYEARRKAMKPFNPELIQKYEKHEEDHELDDSECSTGACPTR